MNEQTLPERFMDAADRLNYTEIISASAGQYQGQEFAQDYGWWPGWDIFPDELQILVAGPDHPQYTETWATVLGGAHYRDHHGDIWHLEQGEGAPDLYMIRDGTSLRDDDDEPTEDLLDPVGAGYVSEPPWEPTRCIVPGCETEAYYDDPQVCYGCMEAYEVIDAHMNPVMMPTGNEIPQELNDQHARRAEAALNAYSKSGNSLGEPMDYRIVDLLADLRHLAARRNLEYTWEQLLARADEVFEIEMREAETWEPERTAS